MSSSFKIPSHVYASMFKRWIKCGIYPNLVVVATYKDLFLWCAHKYRQSHYYVCNVYTMQWVALPPTPSRRYGYQQVGFICDIPDYSCEGHNTQEYFKYKVVRILPPDGEDESYYPFKINVEIFCSETGDWTESVVSSPRPFQKLDDDFNFVYNGRLYFRGYGRLLFFGLGPFNINNKSSDNHELGFTVSEQPLDNDLAVWNLGVFKGCVWVATRDFYDGATSMTVWEFKGEDGSLCLSKQSVYSLGPSMYSNDIGMVAFDPNNKDILYVHMCTDLIKLNIRTREWLKIGEKTIDCCFTFTVELPWWPTTIPRLPQHAFSGS